MSWVLALALVGLGGAALAALVVALAAWGRWVRLAGGVVGSVGLAATVAAAVNLAVPRACAPGALGPERDRPVVSLVVGGRECREEAVGAVEAVVLTGLLTSAVVARRGRRQAESAAS